jgi:hypothetical protein
MKLPSSKAIAFNGAAVLVIGVAAVTQIKSYFHKPVIASCASFYENAVGLGVERGGQLVTAVDIQAGSGGADYGVLEHLTTKRLQGGPAAAAFAIALPKDSAHPDHSSLAKGGIAFPWRPRSLPAAAPSICLSYNVLLPTAFEFGRGGGTLPGVSLSSQDATTDESISTHFAWAYEGTAIIRILNGPAKDRRRFDVGSEQKLPRGRWFRVDQEIVLNTPGKPDGMVRLWIDGDLAAENLEANIRSNPAVKFDGVLADVHFGASRTGTEGRALKDEVVMFTPFELRWRK